MQYETLTHIERWQMLEIEWIDSAATTVQGWHEWHGGHLETDGCLTVGALGYVDEKSITLVLSRDTTTDCVYGVMTIPLSAVTAVHELKRKHVATRHRLRKMQNRN
jgi:hypothetical protein